MIHTFGILSEHPEAFGFYTDRYNGFSCGSYAEFNCNLYAGDDPDAVRKNREWLSKEINARLVIPHQTHGCEIAIIDSEFMNSDEKQQHDALEGKDAVITQLQGVAACISTADCIPILLYDKKRKAVAAIHAGWRGTLKKIASRTIETMQKQFGTIPKDIIACIGPGISLKAFEVGDEVYDAFSNEHFDMAEIAFCNPQTNKYHLDLKKCNRMQLTDCGVPDEHIEDVNICSYSEYDNYFSARRMGINSGRTLTGIIIKTL